MGHLLEGILRLPPLLALAIVGPIAKYFDLRYGNRPAAAPRPVTTGTPA